MLRASAVHYYVHKIALQSWSLFAFDFSDFLASFSPPSTVLAAFASARMAATATGQQAGGENEAGFFCAVPIRPCILY
jgi:hypothetical protein